jgi:AraC-like DNA-binding protein
MINFTINNIGQYTRAEKYIQTISCPWIGFHISGLKYSRLYHPNGTLIEDRKSNDPFFRLALPGMKTEFEYGKNRENWVIMFRDIPLRYSETSMRHVEIRNGKDWITLPLALEIPEESIPGWQNEMKMIQTRLNDPLPSNSFLAKLGVLKIIRTMMEQTPQSHLGENPAGKLKRLIDEDAEFKKTISELSEKCGYCRDHLRIIFQKEFKISPNAYRNQKRLAKVMELISNSSLSIKEIAEKTGFEHSSHLCMEFKKHFGITPGNGVKKFRYSAGTGNSS